jgi:tRNA threonylcarbamoyladenosine biosynthesis protein TsaB
MAESTFGTAVLGVDTATADTAVAVLRDGEVVDQRTVAAGEDGRPRHAATLLAEIEAAVEAAGGWSAIGRIGVGAGPGTFTGVRIGVSTVRALAQGRGLGVVAVESPAALARGIEGAGERNRLALIDARRGELFGALHAADGRALWKSFVATPEGLCERVDELGDSPVAAGDGSLRFRQQLEAAGVTVLPEHDPAHRMAARNICALADGAPTQAAELIKPIYLRRPDAEVWRERQTPDPELPRLA